MSKQRAAVPPAPPATSRGRGFLSVLFSDELKWTYRACLIFLVALGLVLILFGAARFRLYYLEPFDDRVLSGAIGYTALGVFLFLLLFTLSQLRKYVQAKPPEPSLPLVGQLKEGDFEEYDRIRLLRDEKDERDFQHNLSSTVVVEHFSARSVALFPSADWHLQPGINVLLGRNGYGKSLILRALVGLLQRDEESTNAYFREGSEHSESKLVVELKRSGEDLRIERNSVRFAEAIGKVPLLAIPDSRFLDRSQLTIGPVESDTADLRRHGARHFLGQQPFGSVIQSLLYELCLDYWEHGRTFELPVFKFLVDCVRRLTDFDFCFHSIERRGRTGFEIKVITEGNVNPVPIQLASQGTLSVVAMFGLIRSFLAVTSGVRDGNKLGGSGIVVIDEADAHLHPVWQQRVPTLLKDLFPQVQFVLSAHSPLFVAGCWSREVAVLRRNPPASEGGGFFLEQLTRDFIGATASELYSQIFEIEELDPTFLEYSTKASLREQNASRITKLADQLDKGELDVAEHRELEHLVEESRRIRRAVTIARQRDQENDKDLRIAELESENMELRALLESPPLPPPPSPGR